MYRAISDKELEPFDQVVATTDDIRERCYVIVKDLKKVFSEPAVEERISLEIEEVDGEEIYASLKCPLGSGRLRLAWSNWQRQDGSYEIVGTLLVERRILTEQSKEEGKWQPVWAIMVPAHGDPWVGPNGGGLTLLYSRHLGNHKNTSLYSAGLSMIYAIGSGPQLLDS